MLENSTRKAFLLTSYMTGATQGKNLGTPGYSYDIVAKHFAKLLEVHGEIIPVASPQYNLEFAAAEARKRGLDPIHFSFMPFQDVVMSKSMPNVVVPSWEFPDVPDHVFDMNEKNDWPQVAKDAAMIIVGGSFTENAIRKAGIDHCPIEQIQIPSPDEYFELQPWQQGTSSVIGCRAYFPKQSSIIEAVVEQSTRRSKLRNAAVCLRNAASNVGNAIREVMMAVVGPHRCESIAAALRKRRIERRRDKKKEFQHKPQPQAIHSNHATHFTPESIELNHPSTPELHLSGIVYTSIFNPDDGRKNWKDLLNAFLLTLGDKADATLVIKLVTRKKESIERFIQYYLDRDVPHRCKVAFIVDFLTEVQLVQLCNASTYYFQTTRAEGNCLPLLNYLSAGRPGVSPNHSAMSDYFDDDIGFVVSSTREPAAWPHDSKHRLRTSWGRIDWENCCHQLRASYRMATQSHEDYLAMSNRCKQKMKEFASYEVAAEGVMNALSKLDQLNDTTSANVLETVVTEVLSVDRCEEDHLCKAA
jgi:glycosyltransferase involved in cell wall biosynthesis